MAQEVTLPFSLLGNVAGLSGFEDETITIPEAADIEEAVQGAIDDALAQQEAGLSDDDIDELAGIIQDAAGQTPEGIAGIVEETVGEAVPDFTEGLFGPLDVEVDTPQALLEEVQEAIEDIEQAEIPPSELTPQQLDEIANEGAVITGLTEEDAVAEVRRRVREDEISDGLAGEILQNREFPDPIQQVLDIVEDIQETVAGLADEAADAVIDAIEELPGSDILLDPEQFVIDILDELQDLVVSDESLNGLIESLSAFDDDDRTPDVRREEVGG